MDPAVIAALAIVGVVVAGLVVWWFLGRASRRLKQRFGPEYDRAVQRLDSKESAHAELEGRLARRRDYEVRSLTGDERDAYAARWRELQRTFTHQPATGLFDADEVVTALLADVGYPTGEFDRQAADLSVAHADVIEDYRQGRAVVRDVRSGQAGTEEIRVAILRYRTVFERVAGTSVHDDEEVS